MHKVPEGVTDEQVLFLADILPTGYEVGVRNGQVKPGDVVVVVGGDRSASPRSRPLR